MLQYIFNCTQQVQGQIAVTNSIKLFLLPTKIKNFVNKIILSHLLSNTIENINQIREKRKLHLLAKPILALSQPCAPCYLTEGPPLLIPILFTPSLRPCCTQGPSTSTLPSPNNPLPSYLQIAKYSSL